MATTKVLIVDDDGSMLRLINATLSGDDRYDCLSAADGEEALAVARRELPSVIVLDIAIPFIDGIEVCRRIKRERGMDVKVLMVSALPREQEEGPALAAGADEYMVKPFSPMALMTKVDQMLGL